jgi:hypothetical protein
MANADKMCYPQRMPISRAKPRQFRGCSSGERLHVFTRFRQEPPNQATSPTVTLPSRNPLSMATPHRHRGPCQGMTSCLSGLSRIMLGP